MIITRENLKEEASNLNDEILNAEAIKRTVVNERAFYDVDEEAPRKSG